MDKKRYQAKVAKEHELHKNDVCECCGNKHNHTYGSGRFCSKECKIKYIASKNRGAKNPKVKAHLDKLRAEGKINSRAPYGTWKCSICGMICDTKGQLSQHRHKIHYNIKMYHCPFCKKDFQSSKQLGGHIVNCKLNPRKAFYDDCHKRSGKTLASHINDGTIIPFWKGHHHTEESKRKMRISACQYLVNNNPHPCRYNKKSIEFFDALSKERGWNLQHAENGGEFYTGIGYFVDAYDKQRNIVVEYDEKVHYADVENNVLREKDLKRQKEIIDHLHCEYWRYNEKMGVLWKVVN